MANTTSPVLQNERVDILDVLRGFAILGILLDNVFGFTGYGFYNLAQRQALPTYQPDIILGFLEQAFVNGKFYSLFSLLFGIGFTIIFSRNEKRGINPVKIFYRRLFILMLIGLGHLLLLWEGDILLLYALIGFILPLFRKLSDKTLLILAAVLIASPILIDVIKVLTHTHTGKFLEDRGVSTDQRTGLPTDSSFAKYLFRPGSGWHEWRNWQASGYLYRYSYIIETNRVPKVLGMFLIGLYAGRKMIYVHLEQYSSLFKKLRKWGFIIGIPSSLSLAYFELFGKPVPDPVGLLQTLSYAISVVPLSLAYISSICLMWINTNGNNKWKWLAAPGRMALTNYLMQTIICITIFYGVGFGAGGNIGPTIFIPIACCIYFLQVIYSNYWFKYFNYGPMEWIWRQLTYGKRLPLRKR
jgi:uncharacterized protein